MLTIDELAKETGLTPRSIRAYQTKKLIPPPQMHGRVGYYSDEHRELLLLIKELIEQGMNLSAVALLLHHETAREQMLGRIKERAARQPQQRTDLRLPITDEQISLMRENDPAILERLESAHLIRKNSEGGYEASAAFYTIGRELFDTGLSRSEVSKVFLHFTEVVGVMSRSKNPEQVARVLADLCDVMLAQAVNERKK